MNLTSVHGDAGSIPGSLGGSGIRSCWELWCRLQMRVGSLFFWAVASASSCGSDSTPSLGTSMCRGFGPKKQKKKKKKRNDKCVGERRGKKQPTINIVLNGKRLNAFFLKRKKKVVYKISARLSLIIIVTFYVTK